MRKPTSMKALEKLGRARLSKHCFMRDMLYGEIASFLAKPGMANHSGDHSSEFPGFPKLRLP